MTLMLYNRKRQTDTLTSYLREIAYPAYFNPHAEIQTASQLAIDLVNEFYTFLGPRSEHDWSEQYVHELIVLLGMMGESPRCARLTLRELTVINALYTTL